MPKLTITETLDGSHTLLNQSLHETYHSGHGALTEAEHVFIGHGLRPLIAKHASLKIFEIGFGTGLNAALSLFEAEPAKTAITYHAIDNTPLEPAIVEQLNYPALFQDPGRQKAFYQLHQCAWDRVCTCNPYFRLFKIYDDVTRQMPAGPYDLVYMDAFAPSKQPELWTLDILQKLYKRLNPDGVLITYCAQGQFKRNLKACGFKTEALPGPPGRREMTRAVKV